MSYTTILAVYPGDRTEELEQLPNAWRSAPLLWNCLYEDWLLNQKALWALWRDKRVPECLRVALMLTFDRAYIRKEHFKRAEEDLRKVAAEIGGHWIRIAEFLFTSPDIPAVGLWCTSVSENTFHGPYNAVTETYDPLDWSKCIDIYAELDAL